MHSLNYTISLQCVPILNHLQFHVVILVKKFALSFVNEYIDKSSHDQENKRKEKRKSHTNYIGKVRTRRAITYCIDHILTLSSSRFMAI